MKTTNQLRKTNTYAVTATEITRAARLIQNLADDGWEAVGFAKTDAENAHYTVRACRGSGQAFRLVDLLIVATSSGYRILDTAVIHEAS